MKVSLRESLLLITILAFTAFHLTPFLIPEPEPPIAKLVPLFPVKDEASERGQELAHGFFSIDLPDDESVFADFLLSSSATAIESILDKISVDYRRCGHGLYGDGEAEHKGDRPHCAVRLIYRLHDASESDLYEQLLVALNEKLDENSTSVSASFQREVGYMEWVKCVGDTHYVVVICIRPQVEDDTQLRLHFQVTGTAVGGVGQ